MKPAKQKKAHGQRGQLTIFLGVSLILVMTFIAFMVNVGMFVKAKINLQNAVDAAAWSGAATQARLLTNIAHLNWEMRNTYKEWMFKYYVLGNLQLKSLADPPPDRDGMNFRLPTFWEEDDPEADLNDYDRFNVPSICIKKSSEPDDVICSRATMTGLPQFSTIKLPGETDNFERYMDDIAKGKSEDCSNRTALNFYTALTWAFGTGKDISGDVFDIPASHRVGAWVEAMELALRIRNLEAMVNRPPVEAICKTNIDGCKAVGGLAIEGPVSERPVKAFESAFRNLGGGKYKEGELDEGTLAHGFELEELAPTIFPTSGLSNELIPPEPILSGIASATEKRYLDLIPYTVNLATFYTSFTTSGGEVNGVHASAKCVASKTALPVPAYIMGFWKNSEVVTYYAVKGKSNYMGMFFPFADKGGIELSAYAAAKPFGGKIGPMLFDMDGNQAIKPRSASPAPRTRNYLSAFAPPRDDRWKQGYPLPFDREFWADGNNPVGGVPTFSTVRFGVPNLLYELTSNIDRLLSGGEIEILHPAPSLASINDRTIREERNGLYDLKQYSEFRGQLEESSDLDAQGIDTILNEARKPTSYEALNYLIPTVDYSGGEGDALDAQPIVRSPANKSSNRYKLYGPLHGDGTLFKDVEVIKNTIEEYLLKSGKRAVDAYSNALEQAADDMKEKAKEAEDDESKRYGKAEAEAYRKAAASIHKRLRDCDDLSLAGKFQVFFGGISDANPNPCPGKMVPLLEDLREYFSERESGTDQHKTYYWAPHVPPDNEARVKELRAAYMPGPRQGATEKGYINKPFGDGGPVSSRRNFYSTKFISVEQVMDEGTYGADNPAYLEGRFSTTVGDIMNGDAVNRGIRNPLPKEAHDQLEVFGASQH